MIIRQRSTRAASVEEDAARSRSPVGECFGDSLGDLAYEVLYCSAPRGTFRRVASMKHGDSSREHWLTKYSKDGAQMKLVVRRP